MTRRVIGLAIDVHRQLGPGLIESAYEACLAYELEHSGIAHKRQIALPLVYKTVRLDCGYRMDFVVEPDLVPEIKAVAKVLPIPQGTATDLSSRERSSDWFVDQFQ